MIIYSEITGDGYISAEECIKAEKEIKEKNERLKKIMKEQEAQKAYAEEVRALDALYQAAEHYLDVLEKHGKVYFNPDELFDTYLTTVIHEDVEW